MPQRSVGDREGGEAPAMPRRPAAPVEVALSAPIRDTQRDRASGLRPRRAMAPPRRWRSRARPGSPPRIAPAPAGVTAVLALVLALVAPVRPAAAGDFFLHTSGADVLDSASPTASAARFKDSSAVNRTTFNDIGVWAAAPTASASCLSA